MTGFVNEDDEAVVEIAVRIGEGTIRLSAVVDTGFSEFLLLPTALRESSGAKVEREERLTLGDGSVASMGAYIVEVEWFDSWRTIKTYASDGEALVGMKLLKGHDLHIRVVPGGEVRVSPV